MSDQHRWVILAADGVTIRSIGHTDNVDNIAIQPIPVGCSIVPLAETDPIVTASDHQYDPATHTFVARVVPLSEVQSDKVAELTAACDAAILGGFLSSALGSARTYPSLTTDQTNMQRVAVAGGMLWAENGTTWAMETHTAAEGATVLTDFGTYCDTQRVHLTTLKTSVNNASDAASVNAIIW